MFLLAQNYLQALLQLANAQALRVDSLPWLAAIVSPDRWLLWLGVLFVLSIYHFPTGVVGRLRAFARPLDDHKKLQGDDSVANAEF
jgi:branched-chain amino acid transport system permease protein